MPAQHLSSSTPSIVPIRIHCSSTCGARRGTPGLLVAARAQATRAVAVRRDAPARIAGPGESTLEHAPPGAWLRKDAWDGIDALRQRPPGGQGAPTL